MRTQSGLAIKERRDIPPGCHDPDRQMNSAQPVTRRCEAGKMGKEHSKMSTGQQNVAFDPSLIESLPQASKDAIIQKYEYMKGCIDDVTAKCEQLKVNSGEQLRHVHVLLQTLHGFLSFLLGYFSYQTYRKTILVIVA